MRPLLSKSSFFSGHRCDHSCTFHTGLSWLQVHYSAVIFIRKRFSYQEYKVLRIKLPSHAGRHSQASELNCFRINGLTQKLISNKLHSFGKKIESTHFFFTLRVSFASDRLHFEKCPCKYSGVQPHC